MLQNEFDMENWELRRLNLFRHSMRWYHWKLHACDACSNIIQQRFIHLKRYSNTDRASSTVNEMDEYKV